MQCTGAKLGTPEGWLERAETVRTQGTPVMIQGSAQRWFGPGFMEREPELSGRLLHTLRDADRFSYAFCCEALAGFDVRDELGSIRVPTQAIAGAEDTVAPPSFAEEIADGITAGGGTASAVSLEGVAHLAPFEAPGHVAELLRTLITWTESRGAATVTGPDPTGLSGTEWSSRTPPARRSTTAAWWSAARCSAPPTWTAPTPTRMPSPRTSRT